MTVSTSHAQFTSGSSPVTTALGDDIVMTGGIISVTRESGTTTCRVTGSVDLANAATFADAVAALPAPGTRLVIDLSGIDFFGTAGLSVMAGLDDRCSRDGGDLTIVVADAVTRVMGAARWTPAARVTRR